MKNECSQPSPEILFVRTSNSCDSRCFMCDIWKNAREFIPYPRFRSLIDSFPDLKLVRFTGGEPLLFDGLGECIEYCAEKIIQSSIITNGGLLDNRIDELAHCGLNQIIISIDGASGITHDRIRGYPGLFENISKSVRKIVESYPDIRLRANTVVSHRNVSELSDIGVWLNSMHFSQWSIIPIKLEGYCWSDYFSYDTFLTYYNSFLESIHRLNGLDLMGYSASWANDTLSFWKGEKTPHLISECPLTKIIAYYNPFSNTLFPCNCLPHLSTDSSSADTMICRRCEPLNEWCSKNLDAVLSNVYLF